MTNEEINRAITEACGWKVERVESKWSGSFDSWLGPNGELEINPPTFLSDLNAIVGVIKEVILGDVDLERAFIKNLNDILERRADDDSGPVICEYVMAQITADPDEFCEAFLQTIGKWKD